MAKQFSSRSAFSTRTFKSRTSGGEKIVSLRYLPNGIMLQLEVPFHKEFTETLKQSITSKKRIWDNNDKCWYIVRDQLDKLCHILDKYFTETILLDFPAQDVSADAWSKLYLLEGAPLDLVRTAYKTLAKIYHPDKPTGDKDKMQAINVAYKELMGEFVNGE